MNSIRKWIRDVFGFSGNEINGFLILIPLMLLLIFSEPVYHTWLASGKREYPTEERILDSLLTSWEDRKGSTVTDKPVRAVSLFSFDPNTASPEVLRSLGFSEGLAKRIAAYRSKGGVFRSKSDLSKIYGLDSTLYKQLYNYIRLPSRLKPPQERKETFSSQQLGFSEKESIITTFDLNTADTLQLKSVYGIGSRLAARIVKFRDAVGGFVDTGQLREVYGLDSMVVSRLLHVCFIQEGFIPNRVNINKANENELSAHPYIRYKIARTLVSYRFQHGDFMDVSDIKKLSTLKTEDVERLLPYLKVID